VKARVLLSSVFGPYAQDDEYGSRTMNPMELYHNQVTREQGPFSLRMFHRSFGLLMIQANLECPCTVLDFPTRDRFIEELQQNSFDIVGISGIMPNIVKIEHMCALVRQYQPRATVVVGGHVANMGDIESRVAADHVVKGDGIRWFREFLGQDPETPVRHPAVLSAFGCRSFGVTTSAKTGDTAAILIPSVGCPMGCNFCSTSAMFGGKGCCVNFYETGDALFEVMAGLEKELQTQSFFVLDENFLFHKARALRLLELMRQHGKSWALSVFSSARVLQSYTMDQLVGLGISWVWMGLEGRQSRYGKLSGVDTHALVRSLEEHGMRVLGSTIIGLEDHRPEEMEDVIDWAVSHDTVFHQFMLYTPIPGTPLYQEHKENGTLVPDAECLPADSHGQLRFKHRHAHLPAGSETEFLRRAFQRDFEVNGPSLLRLFRVTLEGLKRYKDHGDARIRARFLREAGGLKDTYAAALWAMRQWYRGDARMHAKVNAVLQDLYAEFGWKTRVIAPLLGRVVHFTTRREAGRLASGWTYEPATHCDKNRRMIELERTLRAGAARRASEPVKWVTHQVPATD
jgi:hypothetical protein